MINVKAVTLFGEKNINVKFSNAVCTEFPCICRF